MKQLTALACDKAKATGKVYLIPDRGSLYLRVAKSGSKSWVWRYRHEGVLHEKGLGPYPRVSLAEARREANKLRDARDRGRGDNPHPLAGAATQPTFGRVADKYINDKIAPALSLKQTQDWISRLGKLSIRTMPVDKVETQDVLAATALWADKHKTRRLVLNRIRTVLDAAGAAGYRDPTIPNPARWEGHLEHIVAERPRGETGQHHESMPWSDVPEFMRRLQALDGTASRALEFTILTAARAGDVIGDYYGKAPLTWGEIDLERRLWAIPANRTKIGRDHVVPLSEAAVSLLQALPRGDGEVIFPGMHQRSLYVLLKDRLKSPSTVHGFRASFGTWCEDTEVPPELREAALAHEKGSEVIKAYARSKLVEPRRSVMEKWGDHCTGQHPGDNVVNLKRVGAGHDGRPAL
jgi:integrase